MRPPAASRRSRPQPSSPRRLLLSHRRSTSAARRIASSGRARCRQALLRPLQASSWRRLSLRLMCPTRLPRAARCRPPLRPRRSRLRPHRRLTTGPAAMRPPLASRQRHLLLSRPRRPAHRRCQLSLRLRRRHPPLRAAGEDRAQLAERICRPQGEAARSETHNETRHTRSRTRPAAGTHSLRKCGRRD